MSTKTGKRYEREIARELRDAGWTVERVTGSGGFSGTSDADLVMLAPDIEQGDASLCDHPDVLTAEVKYSAKARGFTAVYDAHLATVGLRGADGLDAECLQWGAYRTAGYLAWAHGGWTGNIRRVDTHDTLSGGLCEWVDGERDKTAPDVVFCRGSRLPWLAVWKIGA